MIERIRNVTTRVKPVLAAPRVIPHKCVTATACYARARDVIGDVTESAAAAATTAAGVIVSWTAEQKKRRDAMLFICVQLRRAACRPDGRRVIVRAVGGRAEQQRGFQCASSSFYDARF